MSERNLNRILISGVAGLMGVGLAACGGGGDAPSAPASTITQANAADVASIAGVFVLLSQAPDLLAGMQGESASVDTQLSNLMGDLTAGESGVGDGGSSTDMTTCTQGGTATIDTVDEIPVEQLSAGDSFAVAYAQCAEDGFTIDGGLQVGIAAYTEDEQTESFSVDATLSVMNLSMQTPDEQVSADGAINFSASSDPSGSEFTLAGNFSVAFTGPEGTVSEDLQSFSIGCQYTPALETQSYAMNAVYTTNVAGGSFTAMTLTNFDIVGSNSYPTVGTMEITTTSVGSLLLTALSDGLTVMLELDENGDGVYEYQTTIPWEEL